MAGFGCPPRLPPDYRQRLGEVLGRGHGWGTDLELWGTDDGDRIDVLTSASEPPEVLARFDLRDWKPQLYERFLTFVRGVGACIQEAETGVAVPPTTEDFTRALRESRAGRFVQDPEAYLRSLQDNPVRMSDEP
ncbi:MAG TPA: hypothetical protein VNB06_14880 [Thermoanaerobaculia bacterium]|nr:hypothetical protein [Thermoanaerobaculia bacterium]